MWRHRLFIRLQIMGTSALAAAAVEEARAAVTGEEMTVAELFALLDTDGDGTMRNKNDHVYTLASIRMLWPPFSSSLFTALAYAILEG